MVLGRRCGERESCVLGKPHVWYLGQPGGGSASNSVSLYSATKVSRAPNSPKPALPALISKATLLVLRPKSLLTLDFHSPCPIHQQNVTALPSKYTHNLATTLSLSCTICHLGVQQLPSGPTYCPSPNRAPSQHGSQRDLGRTQGRPHPSCAQNQAVYSHLMQSKSNLLTMAHDTLYFLAPLSLPRLRCFHHTGCLAEP